MFTADEGAVEPCTVSLAGLHVPVVRTGVSEVVGVLVAWKNAAIVLGAGKGLGEVGVVVGVAEGGAGIVVRDGRYAVLVLLGVVVGIFAKYTELVLVEYRLWSLGERTR